MNKKALWTVAGVVVVGGIAIAAYQMMQKRKQERGGSNTAALRAECEKSLANVRYASNEDRLSAINDCVSSKA